MIARAVAMIGISIGLLAALLVVPGGAEAAIQENNSTTTGYVVDDQVQLSDWEYRNDTFVLTFDANVPREIVLTEAISTQQAQSGQLSIRRRTLPRGESTIRMTVDRGPSGEAALTITSRQGTQQGRAVFVSTGQTESNSASPFAGTSSTAGWIGGAALALVSVVLAGSYKMRRESREPEVAG